MSGEIVTRVWPRSHRRVSRTACVAVSRFPPAIDGHWHRSRTPQRFAAGYIRQVSVLIGIERSVKCVIRPFALLRPTGRSGSTRAVRWSRRTTSRNRTCPGRFHRHFSALMSCTASRLTPRNTTSMTVHQLPQRMVSQELRHQPDRCMPISATWPASPSKSSATGNLSTSGRGEQSQSGHTKTTSSASSVPNTTRFIS